MGDHQIDDVYLTSKRTAKRLFRQGILDSWQGSCAYCGGEASTLDHVRPRVRGGQSVGRNLVACCSGCNRHKGSGDWRLWFRQQQFWCGRREQRIDGWIGATHELAA
jgi:hypothetical protein